MKAIWNNQMIAESNNTIVVEGNHYFPMTDIQQAYFEKSEKTNQDAAWYSPHPKEAANNIKNYVAFWKGVDISE